MNAPLPAHVALSEPEVEGVVLGSIFTFPEVMPVLGSSFNVDWFTDPAARAFAEAMHDLHRKGHRVSAATVISAVSPAVEVDGLTRAQFVARCMTLAVPLAMLSGSLAVLKDRWERRILSREAAQAAAPGESIFDRCGFRFGAVLQPGAYAKLRSMHVVRKVEMSISLPGARAADRERGRSLSQVLDAPLPEGIEKLHISMTSAPERNGRLGRAGVLGLVDEALALGPAVRELLVRGKQDDDTATEDIDLLEQRLERNISVQLGPGGRFPRHERWRALQVAMSGWRDDGALPVVE